MYALHATLTHVLSQLCHAWLPLPAPRSLQADLDTYVDPMQMSQAAWREFCALGCGHEAHWPWAHVLRERLRGDMDVLIHTLERHLRAVEEQGALYVTFGDAAYPPLLRETPDPPAAITMWGTPALLQKPACAIVGARKASLASLTMATRLASSLAMQGEVIISGGAFGCDMAAHQGAWLSGESPIPTTVVFAGGLGHLYPRSLVPLFMKIRGGGGVLLSEKLWWHQPRPYDFLSRNRLISGMSHEVFLIQAAEKSGAATTIHHALQQGRDVRVWAGPAEDDIRFLGNRIFIRDGATWFADLDDYGRAGKDGARSRDSEVQDGLPMPFAWPFPER